MSGPKRHHFVPQAYLTKFVEPGTEFLHIYSKRSDHWRRQKPKQVMVRNRYYHQSWAPEGIDQNILERRLGCELEPKGLEALHRLVDAPGTLDDSDMARILSYIEFQRIRVPRQADMAKDIARTAIMMEMAKTLKGRVALAAGKITVKDSFRFEYMRNANGVMSPYFSRMEWEIFRADVDLAFITTDSPVSFVNIDTPPPTEAGIGLYGTKVLFPLDAKHLLVMQHPEYVRKEKGASDRLPPIQHVEDGQIEVNIGSIMDREDVEHHNWLLYQLSQDVIVSSSKAMLEAAVGKALPGH